MKTDKSTLVEEQEQVFGAVEATKSAGQKPKPKALWLLWAATVAVGVLWYLGLSYLADTLTHESTDDAFLDGHIVSIAPKVSGQVSAVYVTDNQLVKKGNLLVEIDPRDYEMRVEQKRASAQTSDANYKTVVSAFELMQAKVTTAEASERQARAQAEAAQAVATRAAADFKRSQQLVKEGAISQQEFDNAQAAAREAGAKWKADEQNALQEASKVEEAKAQLSAAKTVVEMARAQIKQAQTDVSAAELDLSYAKIFAPCAGQVTRKMVEAGAYVQSGQTLLAVLARGGWGTPPFI